MHWTLACDKSRCAHNEPDAPEPICKPVEINSTGEKSPCPWFGGQHNQNLFSAIIFRFAHMEYKDPERSLYLSDAENKNCLWLHFGSVRPIRYASEYESNLILKQAIH